jgi:hypothetical protein
MAMMMRVAGGKEGEGGKAMAMATRMVGEWTAMATKKVMVMAMRVAGKQRQQQQKGQWQRQQQQWWWVTKRVMAMAARAMATAMRVAGKQQQQGQLQQGLQANNMTRVAVTAAATMWAMATVMRLVGNKWGKGKGSKGKCNSNGVVGIKEGKGGKAMGMATRVAGKGMATARTRAMVTKMKEVGEAEGNGKGGKSNGDGKEDNNGKQR